jgi:hypothetical protein
LPTGNTDCGFLLVFDVIGYVYLVIYYTLRLCIKGLKEYSVTCKNFPKNTPIYLINWSLSNRYKNTPIKFLIISRPV